MALARKTRRALGWTLLLALGVGIALGWRARQGPPPIDVVRPTRQVVAQAITAQGRVEGAEESVISALQAGVLEKYLVKEGTLVSQGQALARMVSSLEQAEVNRARSAVASARALYDEARAQQRVLPHKLAEARARRNEAVDIATLRVEQALRDVQEAQSLAQSGGNAEAGVLSAQAAAESARATGDAASAMVEEAQREETRLKLLLEKNSVAAVRWEQAATRLKTAQRDQDRAEAAVRQAEVELSRQTELLGISRQSAVRRAENALAQARRAQAAARESGDAAIAALEDTPLAEQTASALRRHEEAGNALAVALQRVENLTVHAPYGGLVTQWLLRPGEQAGPGMGVLRLSRMASPHVRVEADERDLAHLRRGQRVVMMADAYPETPFEGVIEQIGLRADPRSGTVEVKVASVSPPKWLRSGLTVDATIFLEKPTRHWLLPTGAVVRLGEQSWVFVLRGGVVKKQVLKLGATSEKGTVVLSGIGGEDRVVSDPLKAQEGQRLSPRLVKK